MSFFLVIISYPKSGRMEKKKTLDLKIAILGGRFTDLGIRYPILELLQGIRKINCNTKV